MKDYTTLKNKINSEKEITTKDIVELGFSHYDIKLFIENNILKKISRGLYSYLPIIEEKKEEQPIVEVLIKEEPNIEVDINSIYKEATGFMIKRELDKAIDLFEKILIIEPKNQYTRFSIFACYMFKKDFQTAYTKLEELYENRANNELLLNIYNYMLLLSELVTIDEKKLNDIANIIATAGSNIKRPKINSSTYKLTKAINERDWENAIKYASISISIDKNQKKYRLSNQCYKYLVVAVIKSKNLVFEKIKEEPLQKIEYEEETPIIVPETKIEQTIKQNLLLEAINNNDYQTALSILSEEQINNSLEIIKQLLTKLHNIQSLVTSVNPVKIVSTEEVRVIDENQMVLSGFEEKENQQTILPRNETQEDIPNKNNVSESLTQEQLRNTAYRAYKYYLGKQNFQEARRNLQRYDYLNNQMGTHRNIKYHYDRVATLEKEYTNNLDTFFKKRELQEKIYDAKKKKSFEEALYLIEEYKKLGGIIHPTLQILEVEIYIMLNNFTQAEFILSNIKDNEEPAYFAARARILYEQRNYEECIKMCISYNERRPATTASNYIMLANCYKRLQKPSKALKALRKAEEINASKNYIKDLSSDIASLEMQAEAQKERRLSLAPKKK